MHIRFEVLNEDYKKVGLHVLEDNVYIKIWSEL
jgi:hypothetical protein